jgi:hypothetical protein
MRHRNLLSLLALNVSLLGAQAVFTPAQATAAGATQGDCCRQASNKIWFCCDQCCAVHNCDDPATDCPKAAVEAGAPGVPAEGPLN